MEFIIRPASIEDAPGIARVHTQSWAQTYRGLMPDDFLDRMTDENAQQRREEGWGNTIRQGNQQVWVAVNGGQVIAFASSSPARDHPGYDAELLTLYSLKEVQGHGVGKALLHAVAREAQARSAKNMALWVLDKNPTRAWYARQGAREAGEKTEGELREIRMVWDDLTRLVR